MEHSLQPLLDIVRIEDGKPAGPAEAVGERTPAGKTAPAAAKSAKPPSIVFIKGNNKMPNRFQIDPWRQTYSTTDSGPTYRIGDNLYVLAPDRTVTRLTHFDDGYVADCEVSWDAKRIVFSKRGGKKDPWWHVWEIGADGKGRRDLQAKLDGALLK